MGLFTEILPEKIVIFFHAAGCSALSLLVSIMLIHYCNRKRDFFICIFNDIFHDMGLFQYFSMRPVVVR